jgi:hypothetical protein
VRGRGVVQAEVPLGGVADPVVVDGHPGHRVGAPAHAQGLVVVREDVPGVRDEVGVLAGVDQAIAHAFELHVVHPDVVGGVQLDAVAVVLRAFAVPVARDVGVADGEVPEDDIGGVDELEAGVHYLGSRAGADEALIGGDGDLDVLRSFQAAADENDQRFGGRRIVLELLDAGRSDDPAGLAAGGAGQPVAGQCREAVRRLLPHRFRAAFAGGCQGGGQGSGLLGGSGRGSGCRGDRRQASQHNDGGGRAK